MGKAKATLKRTGDTWRVSVDTVDGTDFHVQVVQSGVELQEGQAYTLRFRAIADSPRDVGVYALVGGGDFHGIGLRQTAALDAQWRAFEYTFVARGLAPRPLLCPQFLLGGGEGNVYFSDVSVTRSAPGAAVTPDGPFWMLQSTSPCVASLQAGGRTQVVAVSSTDGEAWHVQLNRMNGVARDGRSYTVTFQAKADTPRDMLLGGQIGEGDYHGIFTAQYVALSPEWKAYRVRITPHDVGMHPVFFPQFLVGKTAGTVWIADVLVRPDVPDPADASPALPPAASDPLAPREGEIQIDGTISATGVAADGFILRAGRIARADGTSTTLSSVRPKMVLITSDTSFLDRRDGTRIPRSSLRAGDTVSVIGQDLGVGKRLPARMILR